MKRFLICLILIMLPIGGFAAAADPLEEEVLASLPGEVSSQLDELDTLDLASSVGSILKDSASKLRNNLSKGIGSAVTIIVVMVLEAIMSTFGQKTAKAASLAAILAVCVISIADAGSMLGLGRQVIGELDVFSKALFPAVAASGAAMGQAGSSAAVCALSLMFADVLITLISRLLMPLVYVYIASAVAASAVASKGLDAICSMIKSVVSTALMVLMSAFVLFLNITRVVSASTDAAIVRAAKMTISGAVPIVGSIIADAADTVAAGAQVLRGTLGALGAVGIFALCAAPFMRVGVQYLVYKLTSLLGGSVAGKELTGLTSKMSTAFGMVMGMIGACVFLVLMCILCAIKMAA